MERSTIPIFDFLNDPQDKSSESTQDQLPTLDDINSYIFIMGQCVNNSHLCRFGEDAEVSPDESSVTFRIASGNPSDFGKLSGLHMIKNVEVLNDDDCFDDHTLPKEGSVAKITVPIEKITDVESLVRENYNETFPTTMDTSKNHSLKAIINILLGDDMGLQIMENDILDEPNDNNPFLVFDLCIEPENYPIIKAELNELRFIVTECRNLSDEKTHFQARIGSLLFARFTILASIKDVINKSIYDTSHESL